MANASPQSPRPAPTKDATPPAGEPRQQPLAVFRFESVSAAVFADSVKTAKGTIPSSAVSVRRSYRDEDGTWQHTHTLRAGDLLPAAFALMKAYDFIADAEGKKQ